VATSVRPADVTKNSDGIGAKATIDTKRNYIPPGTHISYYWEFVGSDGKIAYDSPSQQLVYQDERFQFQELQSGVVTVRWYQGKDTFGKAALDKAIATIDRLGKEYNIKPTNNINITIYPNTQAMFTALPPNTAEWVGGQAMPTLGTIVLAIPPNDTSEINRSIPHEVTHQVNYQATKNPYNYLPKWLDEGLAVYNQDQVDAFLTQAFQRGLEKQSLIPLRVLDGNFPADTQQSYMAYGESVNVIQYILKKYGNTGIGKIMNSFKDGVSYNEAIQIGLGISLDELDREWKESLGYGGLGTNNSGTTAGTPGVVGTSSAAVAANPPTPSNTAPDATAAFAEGAVTEAVVQLTSAANANSLQTGGAVTTPTSSSTANNDTPILLILVGLAALVAGSIILAVVLLRTNKQS
jgi:hypothetical protein